MAKHWSKYPLTADARRMLAYVAGKGGELSNNLQDRLVCTKKWTRIVPDMGDPPLPALPEFSRIMQAAQRLCRVRDGTWISTADLANAMKLVPHVPEPSSSDPVIHMD